MGIVELINRIKKFGMEGFKKYYSCYRAYVHSNEDPDNLGRLQLIIPQIHGDKPYMYWAKPVGLFSGKNKSFFAIPSVGDNIWVSFEAGSPRFPLWQYGDWSIDEVPEGATPTNSVYQTASGNRLEFDETDKKIKLKVANKEYYIELNEQGISHIVSGDGKISLGTLDGSAEKAVLGDTNLSKLESIVDSAISLSDNIQQITVGTALGPSTVPLNIANFTQLSLELTKLKATLSEILSNVVTLD